MSENRNSILAKNTIIIGVGQLIPKFIALITLPILTKYLSTDGYGIYDLILSIGSLAIPLMTLLVQQAAFRFIIDPQNDKSEIITCTIGVVGILMIIWAAVIWLLALFGVYDKSVLWMIFLLYSSESLFDMVGQIIRGLGQNVSFSIGVVIYSVANLLAVLTLLWCDLINASTVITVSAIAYIFSFFFLCIKGNIFRYLDLKKFSIFQVKRMMIYSLPIIPSSISLWIVNLSDRLLIIAFLGTAMNGIYATANKIPNLCGTAYSVFNLAWTEMAARTVDDEDKNHYYTELFNKLFAFLVGVFLLLIVISPLIFKILIDEKFNAGLFQMPILFAGIFFSSMVSFLGGIYVALQKTKQVGFSSAVGAVLNLLFNVMLIKKIGLYAASASTVLSFFLIFVYRWLDVKHYINIKKDKQLIISGYICFSAVCILYYINLKLMICIGTILAVIYNYKYNMPMIKIILEKKLKRKKEK